MKFELNIQIIESITIYLYDKYLSIISKKKKCCKPKKRSQKKKNENKLGTAQNPKNKFELRLKYLFCHTQ